MRDDDIVAGGSRRVVGREVLRRAARIVKGWEQDEQEKRELFPRLAVMLVIGLLVALGAYYWLLRF